MLLFFIKETCMNNKKLAKLATFFKDDLLNNILPFWGNFAADEEFGGFTDYLDREGNLLTDEKGGWVQGRATWLYAWVYNEIDKDEKWLNYAKIGVKFLKEHAFNNDGRAFFLYKRDGSPIVLRRYLFAEVFMAMGLAEYHRATGDSEALQLALRTTDVIHNNMGKLESKVLPEAYQLRGHSMTMILINLYQTLRTVTNDTAWTDKINGQIEELFKYFVKPEYKVLMETVLEDGSILDTPAGRTLNPGHAIETAWFLIEEAEYQHNSQLRTKALEILEWSIERGWDTKYGGLYSFLDLYGNQPAPIEWDMKYWWPQCEMIYAALLAYEITGKDTFKKYFKMAFKYAYAKFPDKKFGEWFGYLRRDGSVALDLKGNHFKGPFHIPRMEGKCYLILKKYL